MRFLGCHVLDGGVVGGRTAICAFLAAVGGARTRYGAGFGLALLVMP